MKVALFTDPHCSPTKINGSRRPSLSRGKIVEAMEAFREAEAEICFCLGDLTDTADEDTRESVCARITELSGMIRSYGIPFHLVPGNHDYLEATAEDHERCGGFPIPPYTLEAGGLRFIALDANYRSDMRRFDVAGELWTDSNLPPEQLAYLDRALAESSLPCVVLIHENLDTTITHQPEHIVLNAAEAQTIIARHKDKVRIVLQGHYHPGADAVIDGVRYLTLPAMCEGEGNAYFVLDL